MTIVRIRQTNSNKKKTQFEWIRLRPNSNSPIRVAALGVVLHLDRRWGAGTLHQRAHRKTALVLIITNSIIIIIIIIIIAIFFKIFLKNSLAWSARGPKSCQALG